MPLQLEQLEKTLDFIQGIIYINNKTIDAKDIAQLTIWLQKKQTERVSFNIFRLINCDFGQYKVLVNNSSERKLK